MLLLINDKLKNSVFSRIFSTFYQRFIHMLWISILFITRCEERKENKKKIANCLTLQAFPNIIEMMFFFFFCVLRDENDVSTEEEIQSKGSWIPG